MDIFLLFNVVHFIVEESACIYRRFIFSKKYQFFRMFSKTIFKFFMSKFEA